jgi:transposase InsO family protein
MRADGLEVSASTVERALRRRGLLLPRGFRADRKSWAAPRRKVFHDPPTERNRGLADRLQRVRDSGRWDLAHLRRHRLRHQRTRVRSPQTNGVIERFFGTLKYEHLDRARSTTAARSRWRPPASATSTTASGHTKLSTIERRAMPTSPRDAASH